MATQFNPNYQTMYDAALRRLESRTARSRGMATRGARAAGVSTSGVSQIPQGEIDRTALLAEGQLGSDVAQMQEAEESGMRQRRELMGLQAQYAQAALEREYRLKKKLAKAGQGGMLAGAGIGAIGSYFAGRGGGD